jgi:hypothetical protein
VTNLTRSVTTDLNRDHSTPTRSLSFRFIFDKQLRRYRTEDGQARRDKHDDAESGDKGLINGSPDFFSRST